MRGLMFVRLTAVSLAVSALLTGCGGRELTNVTLIQTLGVDGAEEVSLTAVGEEEADPQRYQTQGEDLDRARQRLRELGATRLEVTHVAQLVLGPDVPVAQVLWQELTNRESGYSATVWLALEESAADLLTQSADPCSRLEALEQNGSADPPTLLEAVSALTREGEVALPVLVREGEDLRWAGTQTIKEE